MLQLYIRVRTKVSDSESGLPIGKLGLGETLVSGDDINSQAVMLHFSDGVGVLSIMDICQCIRSITLPVLVTLLLEWDPETKKFAATAFIILGLKNAITPSSEKRTSSFQNYAYQAET